MHLQVTHTTFDGPCSTRQCTATPFLKWLIFDPGFQRAAARTTFMQGILAAVLAAKVKRCTQHKLLAALTQMFQPLAAQSKQSPHYHWYLHQIVYQFEM